MAPVRPCGHHVGLPGGALQPHCHGPGAGSRAGGAGEQLRHGHRRLPLRRLAPGPRRRGLRQAAAAARGQLPRGRLGEDLRERGRGHRGLVVGGPHAPRLGPPAPAAARLARAPAPAARRRAPGARGERGHALQGPPRRGLGRRGRLVEPEVPALPGRRPAGAQACGAEPAGGRLAGAQGPGGRALERLDAGQGLRPALELQARRGRHLLLREDDRAACAAGGDRG
mmetsp:Transcript_5780/g.17715  ORF Transcript_5780/g.17715 Transcript_5780/m.17715 type:complete len:226 (+) Transcript_5780:720-1397(+)